MAGQLPPVLEAAPVTHLALGLTAAGRDVIESDKSIEGLNFDSLP